MPSILPILLAVALYGFCLVAPTNSQPQLLRSSRSNRNLQQRGKNTNKHFFPQVVERGPPLGNVHAQVNKGNEQALQHAAAIALQNIAKNRFDIADAVFEPKGKTLFTNNKNNNNDTTTAHVRLVNKIHDRIVEGASVVVHIEADGTIQAINGEVVVSADFVMNTDPPMNATEALAMARNHYYDSIMDGEGEQGTFVSDPELAMVRSETGEPCWAWKANFAYDLVTPQGLREHHMDTIYADAHTGKACHRLPQLKGALSIETYNCNQGTTCASLVSSSTTPITTGDLAIDSAHNYAIATYNYYKNHHNRDSVDDNGMTLVSKVHYDRSYSNGFWDGVSISYGDGDGVTFIPLSRGVDVVAHEITHGITERTSALIYRGESGALNEAISDMFGAMVDKQEGATGDDIWLMGEDIYTPAISGDALRSIKDPARFDDYDWYPTRYKGTADNGGIHWNSGIANLAFYLLSVGGKHPRGKSTIDVTGIGMDKAADIFYRANVGCLTAASTFADARYCTADVHSIVDNVNYSTNVHAAWDAVGVPYRDPSTQIFNGVAVPNLNGATDSLKRFYMLNVPQGATASCSIQGNNGDADLFVRIGREAALDYQHVNDCLVAVEGSNGACTAGTTTEPTTLFVLLHGYEAYSSVTLQCDLVGGETPVSTPPLQAPSTSPSETPSTQPSLAPSQAPSTQPSLAPSTQPSLAPSTQPSLAPSFEPSTQLSAATSAEPSISTQPSRQESTQPSVAISTPPSATPSTQPSLAPSEIPSISTRPSLQVSAEPSATRSIEQSVAISNPPSLATSTPPSISMAPSLIVAANRQEQNPDTTNPPSLSTQPSPTPALSCAAPQESCNAHSDCCSSRCNQKKKQCRFPEAPRTQDSTDTVCSATSESCNVHSDCCSKKCNKKKKVCRPLPKQGVVAATNTKTTCLATREPCQAHSDCCSKKCNLKKNVCRPAAKTKQQQQQGKKKRRKRRNKQPLAQH